jgi:hypothetical protein
MNSAFVSRWAGLARCAPAWAVAVITLLVTLARTASAVEILEETIEQKYAVDSNPSVSIRNTDGSVRVYAADVTEIKIQAIKKAYTLERLKGIIVDVKASKTAITIDTIFPPKKSWGLGDRSGTVEYTLIVPLMTRITKLDLVDGEILVEGLQGGSATAHLVNGWLGGHNCFGDLDLSIVNGRLDVAYDWWESMRFSARARSVSGNIRAIIPSDSAVRITAQTKTGRIADAFEPKRGQERGFVREIDRSFGTEAGAQFTLGTERGNIRIDKTY